MNDDGRWSECRGTWDRLRWARMLRFDTAEAAAESLGLKANTYRTYERRPDSSKHTALDHQNAAKFAKKFKVSWVWLLTGEGGPFDDQLPEAQQRVLSAMQDAPAEKQAVVADMIERLLKAG